MPNISKPSLKKGLKIDKIMSKKSKKNIPKSGRRISSISNNNNNNNNNVNYSSFQQQSIESTPSFTNYGNSNDNSNNNNNGNNNLIIKTNLNDLPLLSYCNESEYENVDTILDNIFNDFSTILNLRKYILESASPLMCLIELKYDTENKCIILIITRNKKEKVNVATKAFFDNNGLNYLYHCFENNPHTFTRIIQYLIDNPTNSVFISVLYNEKDIKVNSIYWHRDENECFWIIYKKKEVPYHSTEVNLSIKKKEQYNKKKSAIIFSDLNNHLERVANINTTRPDILLRFLNLPNTHNTLFLHNGSGIILHAEPHISIGINNNKYPQTRTKNLPGYETNGKRTFIRINILNNNNAFKSSLLESPLHIISIPLTDIRNILNGTYSGLNRNIFNYKTLNITGSLNSIHKLHTEIYTNGGIENNTGKKVLYVSGGSKTKDTKTKIKTKDSKSKDSKIKDTKIKTKDSKPKTKSKDSKIKDFKSKTKDTKTKSKTKDTKK